MEEEPAYTHTHTQVQSMRDGHAKEIGLMLEEEAARRAETEHESALVRLENQRLRDEIAAFALVRVLRVCVCARASLCVLVQSSVRVWCIMRSVHSFRHAPHTHTHTHTRARTHHARTHPTVRTHRFKSRPSR